MTVRACNHQDPDEWCMECAPSRFKAGLLSERAAGVVRAALEAQPNGLAGGVPAGPGDLSSERTVLLKEGNRSLRFLSARETAALPAPMWRLDGLIPERGMTVLVGESNSGKTFVALDWSACVASDRKWLGRPVQSCPVLYLAAEGIHAARLAAWERARGALPDDLLILHPNERPPDLGSDDTVLGLIEAVRGYRAGLIVLDPLAMFMGGLDENSARDMGVVIGNLRQIIRQTESSILLVHHAGWTNTGRERGSSALRGGADRTLIVSQNAAGLVTVKDEKARDGARTSPILLYLQRVEGTNSLVPSLAEGETVLADVLTPNEARVLQLVQSASGSQGGRFSVLLKGSGLGKSSFANALKSLQTKGRVVASEVEDGKFYVLGADARVP